MGAGLMKFRSALWSLSSFNLEKEIFDEAEIKNQKEQILKQVGLVLFEWSPDFNDNEKIMGAMARGSAARIFHPYYKSQLETYKNEEWIPYWFSMKKILEHSEFELILE